MFAVRDEAGFFGRAVLEGEVVVVDGEDFVFGALVSKLAMLPVGYIFQTTAV